MYRWPWRRFETMFRRHLLRKAREELRQMRDLRIAALDANPNFDAKENFDAKRSRLEGLQKAYTDAVKLLYSKDDQEVEEDPYDTDPLFDPIRPRAKELRQEINQPIVPNAGVGRELMEAR